MFGLFSRKKNIEPPIDDGSRLWLEYAFLQLASHFGEDRIKEKQIILPDTTFFPFVFNGSKESLFKTAAIVAEQMDVNMDEINLQLYADSIHTAGKGIFTETGKASGDQLSGGLYLDKDESGRYSIFIEKENLSMPENLVAVIAHGLARVILLKDMRTGNNKQVLADLTTVLFGLGIFNANASFRTFKDARVWGYQTLGYLKQPLWGYALALYAYYRGEEDPQWINHLSANVKGDFKRSHRYILANPDAVFQQTYSPGAKTADDELYSGKWHGYYQYGKGYPDDYRGRHVPFILEMEVTDGIVAGTCAEENLKNVFTEPAFIEGSIESGSITFKKTYPSHWRTDENKEIITDETRPSHTVEYSGYFKNNEFAGDWQIKTVRIDKDGVYNDHILRGTWGMKR